MSGFAVARGRYDPQVVSRVSGWERYYLRKAALADFGCAILGVFAAAELRFGDNVTGTYITLSLALPVLWIGALWMTGGYDVRLIGTGSDEYRKVLSAGVGLTAAIAVFSYAINIELSRAYVLIALPSATALALISRFTIRKRLHQQRAAGSCLLSVADPVKEPERGLYEGVRRVGCVQPDQGRREQPDIPDLQVQDYEN